MVTTTGEGGGGDGDGPEPPPPQEAVARKNSANPSKTAAETTTRRLRPHIFTVSAKPTVRVITKSQNAPNGKGQCGHGAGVQGGEAAGMELTCTVSVSVALPLAGSIGAEGLKVHVVPLGTFMHWRFTAPVAPFWELRVRAKLADCPTERVVEVGVMLLVKLGGACTWSVALALLVSEPTVAVTVNG
jgi:hypothetical protein